MRFSEEESREYARHVSHLWHTVVYGRVQLAHEIHMLFDLDIVTFMAHPELLQDLQQLQQRLQYGPHSMPARVGYIDVLRAWDKEARS